MLTIQRRPGEKVILTVNGQRVELVYLGRGKHGDIQLGIIAPREIPVHRSEVQQQLMEAADGRQGR